MCFSSLTFCTSPYGLGCWKANASNNDFSQNRWCIILLRTRSTYLGAGWFFFKLERRLGNLWETFLPLMFIYAAPVCWQNFGWTVGSRDLTPGPGVERGGASRGCCRLQIGIPKLFICPAKDQPQSSIHKITQSSSVDDISTWVKSISRVEGYKQRCKKTEFIQWDSFAWPQDVCRQSLSQRQISMPILNIPNPIQYRNWKVKPHWHQCQLDRTEIREGETEVEYHANFYNWYWRCDTLQKKKNIGIMWRNILLRLPCERAISSTWLKLKPI